MWTCPTGRLDCGVLVAVAKESSPTKKTCSNGRWEVSPSAVMCRGVVANMVVPLCQLNGRRVIGGGPGVYSKHHGIRSSRWTERHRLARNSRYSSRISAHGSAHDRKLSGRFVSTKGPSLRGLNGTPEWIRTTDLLLRRQTLRRAFSFAFSFATRFV